MMKSNELRVGNYVQTSYEGILQIVNINSEGFDYVDVVKPSFKAIGRHDINSIKPIPLNEEWLLKFDILKDNDGLFILSDNLKLSLGIDNARIFLNGTSYLCVIDGFVHQLQNFYKAFTNTELTFKP